MSFIQQIKKFFTSSGDKRDQIRDAFIKMLDTIEVYAPLKNKLLGDLEKYIDNISSLNLEDDDIYKFMWLTIYMYFESNSLNYKQGFVGGGMVIYGPAGAGKTACIASIIHEILPSDQQTIVYTTSRNSQLILEKFPHITLGNNPSDAHILEFSNLQEAVTALYNKPSYKFYIAVESQASIDSLVALRNQLNTHNLRTINGIIITKHDCMTSFAVCSSVAHILSAKIICLTAGEISDKARKLIGAELILEAILNKIAGGKISEDEVTKLLSARELNMSAYQQFLKFMITMDDSKLASLVSMFQGAVSQNKDILKNINPAEKSAMNTRMSAQNIQEMSNSFKIQIDVINSMSKADKLEPKDMDMNKVAEGAGVPVDAVEFTVKSFFTYKDMMKDIDYNKLIETLKKK